MSLAARLAAFAQAVGADIKTLNDKIAATIVASAHNNPAAPTTVTVNATRGTFAVLPLPTSLAPTSSDGVNPDFTRNADGSVTFNKAGTYNVAATGGSANAVMPGAATTIADLRLVLTAANKPAVHDVNDPQVAMVRDNVIPGDYWIKSLAANVQVVAGQRIGAVVYTSASADPSMAILSFSIVRAGTGPAGPKGDLGGTLGANTFRQTAPSAPGSTSNWRTIWISATNEINPAGAFTRNPDGSVTIRDAGWYSVSASFRNVTTTALCTFSLTDTLNGPGNSFAIDTKSLGSNYSNVVAGDSYFAAGATIYANVWTDVATQIELTYFTIARLGGTKGDKGDVGGNTTVALDAWHTVGGASENAPYGAAWQPASGIGQNVFFRKDPFGRVKIRGVSISKATFGWGSVLFTLPPAYRPTLAPQDFEAIVTDPDGSTNSVCQVRANLDGTVALVSQVSQRAVGGGWITGATGTYVRLDGWEFDTDTVIQYMVGPQGPKGDSGGVNAVDTTDWNTATATNFYRGVPPEFKSGADHGPGDTLNPPTTAGFVFTSSDGSIVQRVWDLSMNLGYTRIYKSGAWGSWVKDLVNPRLLTEQAVGLPTPVEGEERYFQNADMKTLGILWKFRYDATAPSGKPKWTFSGGMPYYKKVAASVPANVGASSPWTDLNFTLPLGGDYMVEIGARLYSNSAPYTGNASAYLQHIRNNVVQANYAIIDNWTSQSGTQAFSDTPSLTQIDRIDGALSSDVVQGLTSAAGANAMAEGRWIRITPIRVTM